jgi:hypothetical protein
VSPGVHNAVLTTKIGLFILPVESSNQGTRSSSTIHIGKHPNIITSLYQYCKQQTMFVSETARFFLHQQNDFLSDKQIIYHKMYKFPFSNN